jgi:hypothetical protein
MSSNSSNLINLQVSINRQSSNTSANVLLLINRLGNAYLIPSICFVGFILNIICFCILYSKKLKSNIYNYFLLKTFIETIKVLLGMFSLIVYCENCFFSGTFFLQVFRLICYSYVSFSVSTMSTLTEIALTYDRLSIFKKDSKYLPKIPFKYSCMIIILTSFISILHLPFTFRIARTSTSNSSSTFTLTRTEIGSSALMQYYIIGLNLILNIGLFIVFLVLNLILLYEFKIYMRSHSRLTAKPSESIRKRSCTLYSKRLATFNKQTQSINVNSTSFKIKKISNDDSEKSLVSSVLSCCFIYGVNRVLNWSGILISYLPALLGIGAIPWLVITSFFCRLIGVIVFSSNFILLALLNKEFKSQLKSTTRKFFSRNKRPK